MTRRDASHTLALIASCCERRLIIGTGGYGRLSLMDEIKSEAARRHVELVLMPTSEAIDKVNGADSETNAILHVT